MKFRYIYFLYSDLLYVQLNCRVTRVFWQLIVLSINPVRCPKSLTNTADTCDITYLLAVRGQCSVKCVFCLCGRSKLFSSPNNVHAILKGWKQWTQCSATFYTTGPGCSQYVSKFRFFYVFIIRQAQKSWNKRIFANPSKIRELWILFSLRCDKTIQDRELIFAVRFQSPSSLKHKLTLNSPP